MSIPLVTLEMPEWHTVTCDASLTDQDRELIGKLGAPHGRLLIEELRTGVRVQSRSWVGVVHLSGLEVRIRPKLAGGASCMLGMLAFATGLDRLWRSIGSYELMPTGRLLDLLALLLTRACERIVAAGLLHDYLEEEADLPVLRGRLLADRQLRRRMGRLDRLECRYDDRSSDIVENQILAAALGFCATRVSDPGVLSSARRLHSLFSAACSTAEFDARTAFERVSYNRLNQHYQEAHDLARIVLEASGLEDPLAQGRVRCFAFLIDMNRLFERFIYRFALHALRGSAHLVEYLRPDPLILWQGSASYGRVVPDLLVQTDAMGRRRLPVDAKYKIYEESTRADPSDLYQMFLYAFAYNGLGCDSPQALLVYPVSGHTSVSSQVEIRDSAGHSGARIRMLGIGIPEALAEARSGTIGPVSCVLLEALTQPLLQ